MISVDLKKCRRCGLCAKACPFAAIEIQEKVPVINQEACTNCGACVEACKFNALEKIEQQASIERTDGDIWIFGECDENGLAPVVYELAAKANQLARQANVNTAVVILGNKIPIQQAQRLGVGKIIAVQHEKLARFDDRQAANVLCRLVKKYNPSILLGGATAIGRALLPRCAVKLHTGLTADCTELSIDPVTRILLQTRPAFGGNILATIVTENHRPQMATVRPGVVKAEKTTPQKEADICWETVPEELLDYSFQWIDFIPKPAETTNLRDAEVIVAAGYGCQGPEGVKLVAEFARAIGATLAASRPVVDAGWLQYHQQVGQTGTTIQPKLYIACGISGAIQHWVGMSNADKIIAINTDPDCQMMLNADIAIKGNIFDIIPQAMDCIKKNQPLAK